MRKLVIFLFSIVTMVAQAKDSIPQPFLYPQVDEKAQQLDTITRPGRCELEVANISHRAVMVDLVYDNFTISQGHQVNPGYSLYVPLQYAGYCHSAAYALIYSPEAVILFKDFGYVGQILKVCSGFTNKIEVKAEKK